MPVCLNHEVLVDFLFDRLESESEETVVEHVASCESCRAELDALSDDPMLRTLRACCASGPEAEEKAAAAALLVEEFLYRPPQRPLAPARDRAGGESPDAGSAVHPDRRLPCDLGRYRLLSVLGSGGMGVVYQAVHTGLGRRMAVKLLPDDRRQDPGFAARFRREMQSIGRLQHPHIVLAHDAGEIDGTLYLAMEFVDGCDLETLASAQGWLSVADACEAVRQAALGLAHAHEHGLVHRDIKPSNLLVSRDGVVKVADLGLARLVVSAGAETLSGTGGVVGTLDYMAPEQAERSKGADARSDLYALGCVLFRLLAGRPPFRAEMAEPPLKTLFRQVHEQPPPLGRFRSDLPPEVESLVSGLLAKDPSERPRSAVDVASRLGPHCRGGDLATRVAGCRDRTMIIGAAEDVASLERTATATGSTENVAVRSSRSVRVNARRFDPRWTVPGLALLLVSTAAGYAVWARLGEPADPADGPLAPSAAGLAGSPRNDRSADLGDAAPSAVERTFDAIPGEIVRPADSRVFGLETHRREVWYPLFDQEPRKLVWPENPQSSFHLDRDARRLVVSARGDAYLALGYIDHPSYTIRLRPYQGRWPGAGELGMFFGWREEQLNGEHVHIGQVLSIRPGDDDVGRSAVWRSRLVGVNTSNGILKDRGTENLATEFVTHAERDDSYFQLTVKNHALESVQWGQDDLARLVAADVGGAPRPADHRGWFGVVNRSGMATYRDAEIMLH
ncbi:MAG: serine/threonine-protein kinase [Planctomycetales bacterium]